LLFVLAIGVVPPVGAQEQTGAIQGAVTDKEGKALPGVTLEATGPAGTLVAVTDANGAYRLPRVPVGNYVVKSTLEGFVTGESQQIRVNLGATSQVAFQLQPSSVSETITVVGEATGIDTTSSATSASIGGERIELIPKGRDFTSVATQAAGASQEGFLGGLSIDGASGSENRYVIDGVDTTHPQDGVSGQMLVTDFIEEVQVKSAGYQAEYGGSVGGVVNAVTKSGTNDLSGWVGLYYGDSSWNGSERATPYRSAPGLYRTFDKDDTTTLEPGIAIGGPVVKDKAWFYAGYTKEEQGIDRTPDGTSTTSNRTDTREFMALNVKGNVGSSTRCRATCRRGRSTATCRTRTARRARSPICPSSPSPRRSPTRRTPTGSRRRASTSPAGPASTRPTSTTTASKRRTRSSSAPPSTRSRAARSIVPRASRRSRATRRSRPTCGSAKRPRSTATCTSTDSAATLSRPECRWRTSPTR
jgi:hypothetical protein